MLKVMLESRRGDADDTNLMKGFSAVKTILAIRMC